MRIGLILLVIAVTTAAGAQPVAGPDEARLAMTRFDAAIAEYLRTHRFPEIDLETLCLPDAGTPAAARLDEPPVPREGDVFTPDVARLLRARIAALDLGVRRPETRRTTVAAGEPLAAGRGARVPKAVYGVLPVVPSDLDYRIAGSDLVLLDLRTNVVIDVLREWRG